MPRTIISALAAAQLAIATIAGAAGTPGQQCQSAKNKAAGAYATCRQKAEAALATSADAEKYTSALGKCDTKLSDAWQKAIDKAAGADAACFDEPLTASSFQAIINEHSDNVATALAGGGLTDCSSDLATCAGNLATCTGDLTACTYDLTTRTGDLATCTDDLATRTGGLTTCTDDLTTCTSDFTTCRGDLSSCGLDLGDCNSDLSTCHADLAKSQEDLATCDDSLSSCNASLATCSADYSNCSADLATVTAGTVVAAEVLTGKTFSSSSGLGLVGTMPNNGAASITPGAAAQTIAAGFHNGAGSVAGDPDLVATNIRTGVNLFGVPGTLQPPPLKTGQATGYGPGSDGLTAKGATRSYTDNGDGTITDNVTGLMWEKKSDDGGLNDKDNTYTWATDTLPLVMNGTVRTTFLAGLNAGAGYAGHKDWRIPNVNELQSIADYQNYNPAVSSNFNSSCTAGCTVTTCSCIQEPGEYWTSTTNRSDPILAFTVFFSDGEVLSKAKNTTFAFVRAVRGGS